MNFLKFNVFQMISFGCVSSGFNYHAQLTVMTLIPFGVCTLLFIGGRALWNKKRGICETIILVVTYTVLPTVSTIVFGAFPCDELDTQESYLIADYSINCGDTGYTFYSVYAGLMVLLYPIGIPLLYTLLLWKKREHIKKEEKEREKDEELFGMEFLYDNYKPECWYYEIVGE